jgi:metal-responsive CopG/Arc/MetJ family transcriptional regulator
MKKAIILDLEPRQLALLEDVKKKTGAPRAELIRRAIDRYLKRTEKEADDGRARQRR